MTTAAEQRAATMRRIGGAPVPTPPASRPDKPPRLTVLEFTERLRSAGINPAEMLAGAPSERVEQVAAGRLAREGLLRTVPFELVRSEGAGGAVEGDGLTIEGYGAVFDSETEISGWEGNFVEKIRKGAFKKTLREQTPKMQFDHGHHPLLGGLPLGKWTTAEEDARGMHLVGRLYDNWMVQPFREAIADGAVDGMSFRFSVVKEKWSDREGKEIKDDQELFELLYFGAGDRGPITRELIEVKAPEAGPVVWPAYKDTEVGARSADGGTLTIDLAALREDPRQLADVAALIDSEARRSEMSAAVAERSARFDAIDGGTTPIVGHTEAVHTDPPVPAGTGDTEPPATERPADAHADRSEPEPEAPPVTGDSAGEHSPSSQPDRRPANPTDRKNAIRNEYRTILERTLALPES